MTEPLDIKDFLRAAEGQTLVDVRTPAEFAKGHIPGALNIPLFTDEERATVGTLYKHSGRQRAIQEGLSVVGPRLADLAEAGQKAAKEDALYLYCWRGGMRSGSLAWLWRLYGLNAVTLRGGYKSYRNHILSLFEHPWDLRILGGKTGSRKTGILKEMAAMGEQVLDLEGLAGHKGSAFGNLGEKEQRAGQDFENQMGDVLAGFDPARRVWVEDESRTIGPAVIPEMFWSTMRKARVYYLDTPRQERVRDLLQLYGSFAPSDLAGSVEKIKKRLGGVRHKEMLEALELGNLERVCEISLDYYDRAYEHGLSLRESSEVITLPVENLSLEESAKMLASKE